MSGGKAKGKARKRVGSCSVMDMAGLTSIGGNSALALAVRHGHAPVVEHMLQQVGPLVYKVPT